MKNDCLFCAIVDGEIPSTKVFEDELCYAFRDIAPMAPEHILIIPRQHIPSCARITEENAALVAHIFTVIPKIAVGPAFAGGFRIVSNCGPDAGQTVQHLHFHLLAGKQMGVFA